MFGSVSVGVCGYFGRQTSGYALAGGAGFKPAFSAGEIGFKRSLCAVGKRDDLGRHGGGLDCCLAIVREIYGIKTANCLARLFVTSPYREGGQAQFIEQPLPRKTANENINELLNDIRANLQKNYEIDLLAKRLLMSRSAFTRHFRKATGLSFTQWLIETRLQKARELLESTQLPIEQIAEQIGFQSAVSFRQHFIAKHQTTPSAYRKAFS